jgi:hypothetical protein
MKNPTIGTMPCVIYKSYEEFLHVQNLIHLLSVLHVISPIWALCPTFPMDDTPWTK